MTKLFISYSRDDQHFVEKLASCLTAAGHEVWWDRHLPGGAQYDRNIEAALNDSETVLVVWSPTANQSDWVKDEAAIARDQGKLLPITLGVDEAPLGFRQYQLVSFKDWKFRADEPVFERLLQDISTMQSPDPAARQAATLLANTKSDSLLGRLRAHPVASAIVFMTIAALAVGLTLTIRTLSSSSPSPDGERSIAVLPFADMSPNGDQEYFADGLSEELLNVLAKIETLKVASRTSAFSMKGQNLPIGEMAKILNVRHIVEGSVRKSNDRIRVTAQLIDAHTDQHLWSNTYDRQLSDIFRIQDEIANSVLTALQQELNINNTETAKVAVSTNNLSAYDKYLKARALYIARGRKNLLESMRLYEEILADEPEYAEAWEGLAAVYGVATSWGIEDRDYSALAFDAANKALSINPDLSMAYATIGLVYRTHYPTPWDESLRNLQQAIENNPSNASAHLWLGMDYMALGYHDKALAAFAQCRAVDPALRLCRKYKSIVHLFRGEDDIALKLAEENAEIGYFGDFDVYIPTLVARGDRFTAFTLSRNQYWWGDFPHKDYIAALSHPEQVTPDQFEALQQWAKNKKVSLNSKTGLTIAFKGYDFIDVGTFNNRYEDLWIPAYTDFRQSDAFKKLAVDLGLVSHWRAHGLPAQCQWLADENFTCR